jgi:hypothetical protein
MLVIYVVIVGISMCHIFLCNVHVTRDLARILVIFMSSLACQVRGLIMVIG